MSIVLVIIGLIVGGILVGRDLIAASEVTAQISQITKYNSAVNTFRNKYGGLPGDLNIPLANQFGLSVPASCAGTVGERDGNGLIDGLGSNTLLQAQGETALFWEDLSQVGLIDGQYPNNGAAAIQCGTSAVLTLTPGNLYVGDYFPTGKIGYGTFVYVYETTGNNWFGLAAITGTLVGGRMYSNASMSVIQAYNIDKKMDDGLPETGAVQAVYLNNFVLGPPFIGTSDTTSTCYNTSTTAGIYSISASANGGSGLNCALSFRFQ
jgi:hypothetical protein